MSKHYTKEELDLFRNQKMSILGRMACQAHLNKCPECTMLLEELAEDDKLIREIRDVKQEFESIIKEDFARKTTLHSN